MARQRGPDPATLAAHGVTAVEDHGAYLLTCGQCGETFEVLPTAGRLAPRYWECPNGCNVADPEPDREPDPAPAALYTDLAALPAILTPAEAAVLLRIAETTVKDLARAGDLPGAFKLGKLWRVERDALLASIGLQGKS